MPSDLISRGHVMFDYLERLGRKDSYKAKFEALYESVDNAPAVDAETVRHGEWIVADTPFARQRKCSLCGKCDNTKTAIWGHYCWFCGAKMDGGKQDGD